MNTAVESPKLHENHPLTIPSLFILVLGFALPWFFGAEWFHALLMNGNGFVLFCTLLAAEMALFTYVFEQRYGGLVGWKELMWALGCISFLSLGPAWAISDPPLNGFRWYERLPYIFLDASVNWFFLTIVLGLLFVAQRVAFQGIKIFLSILSSLRFRPANARRLSRWQSNFTIRSLLSLTVVVAFVMTIMAQEMEGDARVYRYVASEFFLGAIFPTFITWCWLPLASRNCPRGLIVLFHIVALSVGGAWFYHFNQYPEFYWVNAWGMNWQKRLGALWELALNCLVLTALVVQMFRVIRWLENEIRRPIWLKQW